jgi:hypothetical protein
MSYLLYLNDLANSFFCGSKCLRELSNDADLGLPAAFTTGFDVLKSAHCSLKLETFYLTSFV